MALTYSTSLSTPCRSSSSYCSSYSSSVSSIYCHSSSSSSSSSSASSASGHVFFSLCFVLILVVLTSLRCSCHYSSSLSFFLLDDSSYHYCWCDLYCQWKNQSLVLCGGSYAHWRTPIHPLPQCFQDNLGGDLDLWNIASPTLTLGGEGGLCYASRLKTQGRPVVVLLATGKIDHINRRGF